MSKSDFYPDDISIELCDNILDHIPLEETINDDFVQSNSDLQYNETILAIRQQFYNAVQVLAQLSTLVHETEQICNEVAVLYDETNDDKYSENLVQLNMVLSKYKKDHDTQLSLIMRIKTYLKMSTNE
jgi:hypothetical protein